MYTDIVNKHVAEVQKNLDGSQGSLVKGYK